ncbi:ACP receptor, partial [Operophtera brumata]
MLYCAWIGALASSLPQSVVFRVMPHPQLAGFEQCVAFDAFSSAQQEVAYNVFCMCAIKVRPYKGRGSPASLRPQRAGARAAPHVAHDGDHRERVRGLLAAIRHHGYVVTIRRTLRMTVTIVSVFATHAAHDGDHRERVRGLLAAIRHHGYLVTITRTLRMTVTIVSVFATHAAHDSDHRERVRGLLAAIRHHGYVVTIRRALRMTVTIVSVFATHASHDGDHRERVRGLLAAIRHHGYVVTIRRTLRMTVTIVNVFAVCWLPYVTMAMWYMVDRQSASRVSPRLQDLLFAMAVSNSCMNPL